MKYVTGIGGVFIKAENPKSLAAWYQQVLGIEFENNLYFNFANENQDGMSANPGFAFFSRDTGYFAPSEKSYMINFRVRNLGALLESCRLSSVQIVGTVEEYDYGKFGWIMDPEGNKIELWEPAVVQE